MATAGRTYPRSAARKVRVSAPAEAVFDLLDDPHRLAGHMERRSWRMAWARFEVSTDEAQGRAVGSHIRLTGRVLGLRLGLDEVVVVRDRPREKRWETTSPPRLLVIGDYRLGFRLETDGSATDLHLAIEYELPAGGLQRALGGLLAGTYARWCLRRMGGEAGRTFPDASGRDTRVARPLGSV